MLSDKEIVERLKKLDLENHILYLAGYIRIQPVNYDKGKLETILWDLKSIQKFLGVK